MSTNMAPQPIYSVGELAWRSTAVMLPVGTLTGHQQMIRSFTKLTIAPSFHLFSSLTPKSYWPYGPVRWANDLIDDTSTQLYKVEITPCRVVQHGPDLGEPDFDSLMGLGLQMGYGPSPKHLPSRYASIIHIWFFLKKSICNLYYITKIWEAEWVSINLDLKSYYQENKSPDYRILFIRHKKKTWNIVFLFSFFFFLFKIKIKNPHSFKKFRDSISRPHCKIAI